MRVRANRDDLSEYLLTHRNWGRWGDEDEVGALNLVTTSKVLDGARQIRTGTVISLSREFPTGPGPENPNPAQHFMRRSEKGDGAGAATDYYGIAYHGRACTHLDALCHTWDANGMWNGRNPDVEVGYEGSQWGGIQHWKHGIATHGVLLDVPRHRGCAYVSVGQPVTDQELREIAKAQGNEITPGDALIVYSGRERWNEEHPPWGSEEGRPGLDASCLRFIRECDCSVLVWDMMDAQPVRGRTLWAVHAAIYAFGVALVDNAELAALGRECRRLGRYEFMVVVTPLPVIGGTGSPVNPIAIL